MRRPDFNQQTKKLSKPYHYRNRVIWPIQAYCYLLKSYFKKLKPKELLYRDFMNFCNQQFWTELVKDLNENNVGSSQFALFQTISLELLNRLAPSKKKTLRNNQSSYITKEVRKAIMTRSRLRNKFLKTKSQECKQAYNNQRNLCVTMVRKRKKNYFNNLNVKNVTDNKQFWKTVKPFFFSKVGDNERIALIKGEKVVSEEREVAETLKYTLRLLWKILVLVVNLCLRSL